MPESLRDFRAGRGQHLRSSDGARRRRARRADSAPAASRSAAARPEPLARPCSKRIEHPQGEVRIGVVGKYVQLEDAYKSLREALVHGGLANHQRVVIEWVEAEDIDSPARGGAPAAPRGRNSGPRRIRQARHPGHGLRDHVRAREQDSVLRHLPGHAVRHDRICARRCRELDRADSTEFDPSTPQSRDLQTARTAGRGRNGRHDAPGRVAVQARARLVRARGLRHARKSPSATAIATNSIASTRRRSPTPASASPAARPTACTSRSSKRPTIRGSSAASSIPNSNRSRSRRIRFSRRSCMRALRTVGSGSGTPPTRRRNSTSPLRHTPPNLTPTRRPQTKAPI